MEEKLSGTIYFKKIKSGNIARLLVLSEAKKEKEVAMDSFKEARFLEDAGRLKKSVSKGSVVLLPKLQIRIGRLMQNYKEFRKGYERIRLFQNKPGTYRNFFSL